MEQVRPIPAHPTYGATTDGRIICLRTEREIKQCIDPQNYKWVWLTNKDGTNHYLVSRLVASTFIPNPDNKEEVDHIDRNRGNNDISNLRWANDYDQSINKVGWGKYKRYLYRENYGTYECWTLQIRNHKVKTKRRFDCSKYTLDEVTQIRNTILTENNIPITD